MEVVTPAGKGHPGAPRMTVCDWIAGVQRPWMAEADHIPVPWIHAGLSCPAPFGRDACKPGVLPVCHAGLSCPAPFGRDACKPGVLPVCPAQIRPERPFGREPNGTNEVCPTGESQGRLWSIWTCAARSEGRVPGKGRAQNRRERFWTACGGSEGRTPRTG